MLERLAEDPKLEAAASQALAAMQPAGLCPAILIPINARPKEPSERIYPLVVDVPVTELNLLDLHQRTIETLNTYEQSAAKERVNAYAKFDRLQRHYLATLAGLGQVLSRARESAVHGESAGPDSLELLAYMPAPVQRLLDQAPNRSDVLNELMKGQEVLVNVGAATPGSSLSRFNAAKDDHEHKVR